MSTSEVEYGTTTDYGTVLSVPTDPGQALHSARIANLDHSTNYHFRIRGTDEPNDPRNFGKELIMKPFKFILAVLASLGLCSVALATEEKFEENYKVEKPVQNERQIASEKESVRDPSSVATPTTAPSPEVIPDKPVEEAPQPWLHKPLQKNF